MPRAPEPFSRIFRQCGIFNALILMTELQRILLATKEPAPNSRRSALATLVGISGSSYRRPGARILVKSDGTWSGAISGGCLEGDVLLRAKRIIAEDKPTLVRYDTTDDNANVFGVGLGCNGILDILIEPFDSPAEPCIAALELLAFSSKNIAHAVVFRSEQPAIPIGTHWVLDENTPQSPGMWTELFDDCRRALEAGGSINRIYSEPRADVFIEIVRPQTRCVIFGAGRDAVPVAQFAANLGWHVTVTDKAPAKAQRTDFPTAAAVFAAPAEEIFQKLALDENTVCVVMSHNFGYDAEILRGLLASNVAYIGLLGPRKRWEKLRAELEQGGVEFTENHLATIHSPVGLDLGAETPEEIGLAVVAEILAVLRGGGGAMLRSKTGTIHGQEMTASGRH